MQIVAHRGMWQVPAQKNSLASFKTALEHGFGVEFDVRDLADKLVVSHDLPTSESILLDRYLECYTQLDRGLPLAINIKSCGLQTKLKYALKHFSIGNYFVFDLAVPDALAYLDLGLSYFTRQSEIEREAVLYELAQGVWLDQFYGDWITPGVITQHIGRRKLVCLVSPELHGRDYGPFWELLREFASLDSVMLCTDHPKRAEEYFHG